MRAYRLSRVRERLVRDDYAGVVLFDPINIRYVTGSSNMQVWILHNPSRYAFVATDGPSILFDYHGASHLVEARESIDEFRNATSWFYFSRPYRPERWQMPVRYPTRRRRSISLSSHRF